MLTQWAPNPNSWEVFNGTAKQDLSQQNIGDHQCEAIGSALKSNFTITDLNLEGNKIGVAGIAALVEGLCMNNSLRCLNLRGNAITNEGATILSQALDINNTLQFVNVDLNGIDPDLMDTIQHKTLLNTQCLAVKRAIPLLIGNEPSLTSLDLSEYAGQNPSIKLLADALKYNTTLVDLSLAGLDLGNVGCDLVSRILSQSSTLTTLNISDNNIKVAGFRTLSGPIGSHHSLACVDLSQNGIGDEAARGVVDLLRKNMALKEFDVSFNGICDQNMAAIQYSLKLNQQPSELREVVLKTMDNTKDMTRIDLNGWSGVEDSIQLLSQPLIINSYINRLDFSYVGVGDQGVMALATVLKVSKVLTDVNLVSNKISAVGAYCLAQALHKSETLTALDVSENAIGDDGGSHFLELLHYNDFIVTLKCHLCEVPKYLLLDIDQALSLNEQPLALKRILPYLYDNDPEVISVDFSVYDGHRYHNDTSVDFLCRALQANHVVSRVMLSNNSVWDSGATSLAGVLATNTTIKCVDLSGNSIGKQGAIVLCEALVYNTSLTKLDMSDNNLGEGGGEAFADLLQTNHTLTMLKLNGNKISDALMERIRIQSAYNTQPQSLKDTVSKLQAKDCNLLTLDFSKKQSESKVFNDITLSILSKELGDNDSITHINLANNRVEAAGTKALAEWLALNTSVNEVNLSGNCVGDLGCMFLCQALKQNCSVHTLHLQGNGIGEKGAMTIIDTLKTNDTLVVCGLEDNPIDADIITEIDDALALNSEPLTLKDMFPSIISNDPSLTVVDLSNDQQKYCTDATCRLLGSALKDNTHIISITLMDNKVGPNGAKFLGEAIAASNTLKTLNLNNNMIGDEGVLSLAQSLERNDSVEAIYVDNNGASARALQQLEYQLCLNRQPKTLKSCIDRLEGNDKTLMALDFSPDDWKGKKVDDDTLALMAPHLKVNTALTALDFAYNKVSSEGAYILADILKVNTTLQRIDLTGNQIGNEGGKSLARALKMNGTLLELRLEGNTISPGTLEDIHGVLEIHNHVDPMYGAHSFHGFGGDCGQSPTRTGVTKGRPVKMSKNKASAGGNKYAFDAQAKYEQEKDIERDIMAEAMGDCEAMMKRMMGE